MLHKNRYFYKRLSSIRTELKPVLPELEISHQTGDFGYSAVIEILRWWLVIFGLKTGDFQNCQKIPKKRWFLRKKWWFLTKKWWFLTKKWWFWTKKWQFSNITIFLFLIEICLQITLDKIMLSVFLENNWGSGIFKIFKMKI